MPRAKKDDALVAYVLANPRLSPRSVDTMAEALGMTESDLRTLVHYSPRVRMRAVLLGWHVVELAEQTAEKVEADVV